MSQITPIPPLSFPRRRESKTLKPRRTEGHEGEPKGKVETDHRLLAADYCCFTTEARRTRRCLGLRPSAATKIEHEKQRFAGL
jgi:hypothetical protein